jgi:hypothetical protein
MDETTRQKFQILSTKIGVDMGTLEKTFEIFKTNTRQLYPGKDEAFYEERARILVYGKYADRSPSVSFDHLFFYVGEAVDYTANMRELALVSYKQNPQQAKASGLVDDNGTPMDTRQWLVEPAEGRQGRKNPNVGKPLQPFKQRRALGFATRFGGAQIKMLSGTLREKACEAIIPVNTAFTARYNIRSEDAFIVYATSGRKTTFDKPSTNPIFAGWNDVKTAELLEKAPFKRTVYKVEEFHEQSGGNPQAVLVLDTHLMGKADEPTSRGSYLIRLGAIEDFDFPPVTCFIEEDTFKKLDGLGIGTRLLLIGTTTLGMDLMTNTKTSVIINGLWLHVLMPVKSEELRIDKVSA